MVKKIKDKLKLFSVIDWGMLGILIFICFICFQHADIWHTGGSSISYLNGHILDFYDYNSTTSLKVNNYMPTTYIIFAIWNIPLRVFKIVTASTMTVGVFARMWYKLLTALFYLATTILIYKICLRGGVEKKKAITGAFLFASNPIAIYSEFIFGQYDIITTFFVVTGIYYYICRKDRRFIFFFSVALTCKYFALLIVVPLVLLRYKNIWHIIKHLCGVMSVFLIEVLIYITSEAFRRGVFSFDATNYIFNISFNNGFQEISLVIMAFIALCVMAFQKKCITDMEELSYMIHLLNILCFIMFGLSFWHPQWLLIAVPFWTLGAIFHKRNDVIILMDLILYVLYIIFSTNFWKYTSDQGLFLGGIFRRYIIEKTMVYNMADVYKITSQDIIFSIIVAIMLAYAVFTMPKNLVNGSNVNFENSKGIIRLRYIGGILWFLIPAFFCLYKNFTQPDINWKPVEEVDSIEGILKDENIYVQKFVPEASQISQIYMKYATYNRRNSFDLRIQITNADDEILYEQDISTEKLRDNTYTIIKLNNPIFVNIGEWYSIRIFTNGVDDQNAISLYQSREGSIVDRAKGYAEINGEPENFNFAIEVLQ